MTERGEEKSFRPEACLLEAEPALQERLKNGAYAVKTSRADLSFCGERNFPDNCMMQMRLHAFPAEKAPDYTGRFTPKASRICF